MPLSWSAIHTKVAREFDAASRINLLGFETFCPIFQKQRHHNHQIEQVSRPLFPRYFFVRFDRDRHEWGKILTTRGVADFVRDGMGKPSIMPDIHMVTLKAAIAAHTPANDEGAPIKPGDKVRLLAGPFSGFEALFCEDAKARVSIMLSLFGRPTKLFVPTEHIQAISRNYAFGKPGTSP